jgi:hypothetical protein
MATSKTVGSSTTSPTSKKTRKVVLVTVKPKITSETIASVPADRKRLTVGVGEKVNLIFTPGIANWSTSGGKLSSANGETVRFTAPDREATIIIKAAGIGGTADITFKVIEPRGVLMEKGSGTRVWHVQNIPSVGIRTSIYIQPATVSFENIEAIEDDCSGLVTGYFIGTSLDGVSHGTHGGGTQVKVGPVVEGKGSRVLAQDTAASGHCNFGEPYSNGTFDWPIPWKFRVSTGENKEFSVVHQRFTIDEAGAMNVTKAGASGDAGLAEASSNY